MTHGNIEKLLAPIDTFGARCGLDSSVKDKPYLVFFDISKCLSPGTPIVGCPTPQVATSYLKDELIFLINKIFFSLYFSLIIFSGLRIKVSIENYNFRLGNEPTKF